MRKFITAVIVIGLVLVITDTALAITCDIKANGTKGSVTIGTSDQLAIDISLSDLGSFSGDPADLLIVVNTPSGWQYYDLTQGGFTSGLSPTIQGISLVDLDSIVIFNTSGLGVGTYTYYFAVDLGGGQLFWDSVEVIVTDEPLPKIYANSSGETVNINEGDPLAIAISLSSNNYTGTNADWWIAVNTPSGWQHFDLAQGDYVPGLMATIQGFSLVDFGSIEIFNTSGLGAGTYTYYFAVAPSGGQLFWDSVIVNIISTDITPPTVNISSPVNGTKVSGTVPVSATASDNVAVERVEFYVDGLFKSTVTTEPYGFSLNTASMTDGNHTIKATAYDTSTNSASDTVTVEVDNGPKGTGTDTDGDGFTTSGGDCNDNDASINPDALEVCDSIDNNCDGQIDEGTKTTFYADSDGDGYGNPNVTTEACEQPTGYVTDSADCDDNNSNIYPDASEIPNNGIDEDCNGSDLVDTSPLDQDGDGFTPSGGDCNDNDINIFPGATELCNGIDNNCDNVVDDGLTFDIDGDGFSSVSSCSGTRDDCDDNNAGIHPGATDIPGNGIDEDCDGSDAIDPDDIDDDGDGYTESEGDCVDNDVTINPDALEICDGVDNDCDGEIDEGTKTTFYADSDGDGYGNKDVSTEACEPPTDYVTDSTDCNDNDAAINPGATDIPGNGIDEDCDGTEPPLVTITSPATLTTVGSSPIMVTGTVDKPDATVTVNGVNVTVSNGTYTISGITLTEGSNTITAMAIDEDDNVGTAHATIYFDSTPPLVTINSPEDGYVATSSPITVTGIIYDIVKGTVNENNATVDVNGISASVSNKTFMVEDLPLVEGENIITATAADQTGNTASTSISIMLDLSVNKKINMLSGNNQTGTINTQLPGPLVISLTNADGSPASGETVIFKVIQNNGLLTGSGPAPSLAEVTDANGVAFVLHTLGSTSGVGNNKVEVTSVGFTGQVVFTASATEKPPHKINIGSGNNQRGAVITPLPNPLVAVVTDEGHNVIKGVPVTFTVTGGGGNIGGSTSTVVNTDSDGRATISFTLGTDEGLDNNIVEADFAGNTTAAAIFRASGLTVGDPGDTSISGIVLDNSNIPIPGVTLRVEGTTREDVTDDEGQFMILNVPVGPLHLIVDGSTATFSGEFPVLSFEIVTVAGQNNTLGMPIYLLPLNTENTRWVGGDEDVVYELENIPGFSLNIKANSVTFPDGSNEGFISVTQVHADKVPMEPPNGLQPRFIITIQPPGAVFDPPAPITIPNVDGLAPGAITEMYSFDHDLGQFVSIGTGTVSEDGMVIASDPGVGIIKAGWHCGGDPAESGCTHVCGACQKCVGDCECVPDPSNTAGLGSLPPFTVPDVKIDIKERDLIIVKIPKTLIKSSVTFNREKKCCTNGEPHLYAVGNGLFNLDSKGPTIKIPIGGGLLTAIDKIICKLIKKVPGFGCEIKPASVSVDRIKIVNGKLGPIINECLNKSTDWTNSSGTINFVSTKLAGVIGVTLFKKELSFSIFASTNVGGPYIGNKEGLVFTISDDPWTVGASFEFPNPIKPDDPFKFELSGSTDTNFIKNKKFSVPLPTLSVPST